MKAEEQYEENSKTLLAAILLFIMTTREIAEAHPGGTDGNGGHKVIYPDAFEEMEETEETTE
ncbi:hypothetical protein [Ureibacillus sp. GCM10028918]|uniref:hypothetical protein n=1 Tax=Ureibacillus sp. GCM10028918 TaxID=3273429 RepID=UPI003618CA2A